MRKAGSKIRQKHIAKPAGVRGNRFELHCRAALLALKRDIVTEQQLTDLWSMAEIVLTIDPTFTIAAKSQMAYARTLEKGHVLNTEKSEILEDSESVFNKYMQASNLKIMQACEVINKKYLKGANE